MAAIDAVDRVRVMRADGTAMPIADYPRASVYPIVRRAGAAGARKSVGFVMVGGTEQQFQSHLRKHRRQCQELGYLRGPCIHAETGTIDF